MNKNRGEPLFLPALRATMGDWVYYVSFMRMGDIASRVSVLTMSTQVGRSRSGYRECSRTIPKR